MVAEPTPEGNNFGFTVEVHRGGTAYELGLFNSASQADLAYKILAAKDAGRQRGPAAAVSFEEVVEQLRRCVAFLADTAPGLTLLHAAAHLGLLPVTQLVLARRELQLELKAAGGGQLPLHVAAHAGHNTVARLLLRAAPAAALRACDCGLLPLHLAVLQGHEATARLLLRAAPAAAMAAVQSRGQAVFGEFNGCLPLHLAASVGNREIVRLLLTVAPAAALVPGCLDMLPLHLARDASVARLLVQAAPEAVLAGDDSGALPLHFAAIGGRVDVAQVLLRAAPGSAAAADADGCIPLIAALDGAERGREGCAAAATLLAAAMPAQAALSTLVECGGPALPLFVDCVAAHLPLGEAEWALVPAPCPGLGRVLPAALACSPAQASQVVRRLPPVDAARLRTFGLCLARAQRRSRVALPPELTGRLMALFDCRSDERRPAAASIGRCRRPLRV